MHRGRASVLPSEQNLELLILLVEIVCSAPGSQRAAVERLSLSRPRLTPIPSGTAG